VTSQRAVDGKRNKVYLHQDPCVPAGL